MKIFIVKLVNICLKFLQKHSIISDYLVLQYPYTMVAKLAKGYTEIKIIKIPEEKL